MLNNATQLMIEKGVEPARWLLVLAIAYTLATTLWSFFDTPEAAPTNNTNSTRSAPQQNPANINWILSKHLFGEAGAAPVQTVSDAPARETRLPLKLQSVFMADVAEESSAIIAHGGKPGLLYRVGADIPGNATLIEVLGDRVILRRAGVRETLMFPKGQFTAEVQTVASPAEEAGNSAGSTAQQASEPTSIIDDYREKLATDAEATLDELGIESAETGGYRLGSNAQSAYLKQTGLQPGDVIMSVNGRQVGNIEQDQLELENILAQGSARIEVQRGSRRFFITVSLN